MVEAFAAIEGQGEGDRLAHVVRIGRSESRVLVWHAWKITGVAEQDKNIDAPDLLRPDRFRHLSV
jgi:hypothetical protein